MHVITRDIRLLLDEGVDPVSLTRQLVGEVPFDTTMLDRIHGAAELDEHGVPMPRFPVRAGVEWDGWPRDAIRYSMGMDHDAELERKDRYAQIVKVYEHRNDGKQAVIVAAGMINVLNGAPEPVCVTSDDGRTVYVPDGKWEATGGTWACAARSVEDL
jgi:hypothetical protein